MPILSFKTSKHTIKKLEALASHIVNKRKDAVEGRKNSGIEDEWKEDTDLFEGHESSDSAPDNTSKFDPLGLMAPVNQQTAPNTFSKIFLNITLPYTNSSAARLADLITKSDELPWSIEPTPVQDLEEISKGFIPQRIDDKIREEQEAAGQQMQSSNESVEQSIDQTREDVVSDAREMMRISREMCDKAQRRIKDWQSESKFLAELRKVINDSAKLGTGVLKGPFPMPSKSVKYTKDKGLVIHETMKPFSARVDPWNCFPDPTCGEDVSRMDFHFERDWISKSDLRELAKNDIYFSNQIETVIKEGSRKTTSLMDSDKSQNLGIGEPNETTDRFAIWYDYQSIDMSDLLSIGGNVVENGDYDVLSEMHVMIVMVGDRIIGIAPNPLHSGSKPYDYFVWSPRSGQPWGKGVPRIIRSPQKIANGATRMLMDNAGRAGGPMVIYNDSVIEPVAGSPSIQAWKMWRFTEDTGFDSIEEAFHIVNIPMYQQELQNIVHFSMEFSEKVTGMPWLMMGQQAPAEGAASGVGAMRMMNENAGASLRELGSRMDDQVIEPHVRRYYEYLLQYGPEDDEKGDLKVVARGATTLVERDRDAQSLQALMQMVNNPVFGIDPKKYMDYFLNSIGLDTDKLHYSDEEWQSVVQQMTQPPPDPKLEIENMRLQAAMAKLETQSSIEDRKIASELIVEQWRRESSEKMSEWENNIQKALVEIKLFEAESKKEGHFDNIKEKLSEAAMNLRNQREMMEGQLDSKERVERMKLEAQRERERNSNPTG